MRRTPLTTTPPQTTGTLKLHDWTLQDDFEGVDIAGLDNEGLDIDGLDNGGLDIDGLDIAGLDIVGLVSVGLDNDGRMCGQLTELTVNCKISFLEKIFTPCLCLKHTRCLFYVVIN